MKNSTQDYKTIGIICWGLMGDVLMRTPVIHAFRQIFPNATIIALVDPIGEEVLKNNPDINDVIVMNRKKKPFWKYFYNKLHNYVLVNQLHFDLMVDLYNGRSSANFMRMSNANNKIGFSHSKLPKNTYNILFEQELYPVSSIHISRSLLKITAPFGGEFESYSTRPSFTTRKAIDLSIKKYFEKFQLLKPYLLNLGSGGAEKMLPMDKSFAIVKQLYQVEGFAPLVICNPGQEDLQDQFVNQYLLSFGIPYGTLKKLSLEEIASMMKLNHFIITPDTGLYHLAVAVQIPILGIFTYTDPCLVEPDSGLYLNCFQALEEFQNAPIRFGTKDLEVDYLLNQVNKFTVLLNEKNR